MSLLDRLRAGGFDRGGFLAISLAASGLGAAWQDGPAGAVTEWQSSDPDPAQLAELEAELRPRWVWWSPTTAQQLTRAGLRVATCWDLAAVHRLLFGGWRAEPGGIWAALHDLATESLPATGQLDLLGPGGD
ncbi:MAG: DNA polymerase I, partial [Jatrophihabitantaceae bacterium]